MDLIELYDLYKNKGGEIVIVSQDIQDKGEVYSIPLSNVISLDYYEDETTYEIWWKTWSPLEGKNFTSSARFSKYEFKNVTLR